MLCKKQVQFLSLHVHPSLLTFKKLGDSKKDLCYGGVTGKKMELYIFIRFQSVSILSNLNHHFWFIVTSGILL